MLGSCSQPCDNTLPALVTEWASSCSTVGCFVFCLHLHFVEGILALGKEFLLGLKETAKPHWGWLRSWGKERMKPIWAHQYCIFTTSMAPSPRIHFLTHTVPACLATAWPWVHETNISLDLYWHINVFCCVSGVIHSLALLPAFCCDFFFPTMASACYWSRNRDEAKITHSTSSIFIGLSVFTGLPLTFNCRAQRYSMGHCHATPKPNSSQMLITILQQWHRVFQHNCAGTDHSQSCSFISGVFWDLVYKSLWHAEGCLAEVSEQLVVLLLLLERLVEKPTWHAAATWLGPSQQRGVITLRHGALHSRYWLTV